MKLLVHSYFPVLRGHQAGGAQYAMHEILLGLAENGFEITLICPEADCSQLISHANIHTHAVLKEKVTTTLTLQERTHNLRCITECLGEADVVWTLDAGFPLSIRQPIVLSLQTIAYEDELNSLLGFNWDTVVVPSTYLKSVIAAVANPAYWPAEALSIRVIQNGIDTSSFIATDSSHLRKKLALQPGRYLLFPHRPEPAKGFRVALAALQQLVARDPSYKLLIPTNPDSVKYCLAKERTYYRRLASQVQRLRLEESVVFHPWIEMEELPAYYSMGEWCLVLSELPEGFGFTAVQAISCGTAVISTRAGALRERFPPHHGVTYVDPGAVEQIAAQILTGPTQSDVKLGRLYVEQNYSIDRCVREYADCFLSVSKATKHGVSALPMTSDLRLSPWCYMIDQNTIWHDLYARRVHLTQKQAMLLESIIAERNGCSLSASDSASVEHLITLGVLVQDCVSDSLTGTQGRP